MQTNHDLYNPQFEATRAFAERFGSHPRLFSAPGRINIIGEHTDYSQGFVMPAAINRNCVAAIAPNTVGQLRVFSCNRAEQADLGETFVRRGDWTDYVGGVRAALRDAGIVVPGCDLVISSDVPEGAGVSSSAALEVSVMSAMISTTPASANRIAISRWAQVAEATYVGMPCGIMDQFIAAHGIAEHAIVLDCQTLAFAIVRVPQDTVFIVIDSQVRHRLVDGGYASRRLDCETAARLLGVSCLRDANKEMLALALLPERLNRRARHVITENLRVAETAVALAAGDVAEAGRLMIASHTSLREDFEVTCEETDRLAAIAASTRGVLGARQMGGGFGGSVLALCNRSAEAEARQSMVAAYEAATGLEAEAFTCTLSQGAHEIAA